MPVAHVTEFDVDPDDSSTTNYDAISERIGAEQDPPAGLIVHTAGFTGDGVFRIFDVWETREQAERFDEERVMPAVEAVAADANRPARQYFYDLHHVAQP